MKQDNKMAVVLFFMGVFLLICFSAGEVFARFPTQKLYIPCYHSRPLFIKNYRPEPVSPVKKVSVNEPGIAEVKIITPYELVIDARHPGSTMCIIWYENNETDFFEIRVTLPRPVPRYEVKVIKGIRSLVRDSIIRWEW
ncbi:MAG: pilus assembly protein N-terminal domain-containing protein [Syntrophobacterales bacterium]|nr:pilus assembly protein N-terminal domain-containing protein [Syntrophobacterales bacterium]